MIIEKDVVCPYCDEEFSYVGFTEFTLCPVCNIHFNIYEEPYFDPYSLEYEKKPHKHVVEGSKKGVGKVALSYLVPGGFEVSYNQSLSYENSCRCLREICPSCMYNPECSLKKSALLAMGGNYPIFPAEWLIVSSTPSIAPSVLPHNYIICHRYNDGQIELMPGMFPKVNYLPQAEKINEQ